MLNQATILCRTAIRRERRGLAIACCILLLCPLLLQAQSRVIDAFNYASTEQAAAVWRAVADSPPATRTGADGLTFPIPFRSTDADRVYWDRKVSLDLSGYDTIQLDISSPRPDAMRSLTIYLQSGDGWYVWGGPLPSAGRHSLNLMKADFQTEGNPAGWDQIDTIRLSPWRGEALDTTLTLHQLAARNPSILLIRGGQLPAQEQQVARRTTQRISRWLTDININHAVIDDHNLTAQQLSRARVAVLPYLPTLSPTLRDRLQTFVESGGRVMAFYSGDEELATMLGFRLGAYKAAEGPGRWSAIRFDNAGDDHLPERVYQNSWNIRPAHPASRSARVIAYWENALGNDTRNPAWVASDRGLWMSHILLQGDEDNKRAMLSGLLASMDPTLWADIAGHAVQQAGKIGPYGSLAEAQAGIRAPAASRSTRREIESRLKEAGEQYRRMQRLHQRKRYPQAVDLKKQLQRNLLQAYALAQQPRSGELRGVWDHHGTGLYPGAWERTARLLADHGINAIFPNLLWGGLAHYPSDVLPRSTTYRTYGDQLAQCIEGARRHGLDVHVWIVCWNLTGAPADFTARMRAEGRLMQTADGAELPWLNPAHPENRKLMIESLKEVAENYDIDGIHLDYIRYPNRRACYSDYTRKRFEQSIGRRVRQWPADALPGGRDADAYRQFRVEQINLAVEAVHNEVARKHPDLKISAAVWGGYPDVIESIGQDWASWLARGQIDFAIPMNYTTDHSRFMTLTRSQLALPGGQGRILPGIGVTASESQLSPDQVIQQIHSSRTLGAPGWVLFDLNNTLRAETLPALSLGVTRGKDD